MLTLNPSHSWVQPCVLLSVVFLYVRLFLLLCFIHHHDVFTAKTYHSINLIWHLVGKSSVAFSSSPVAGFSFSSLLKEQMLRKQAELESAQCRLQLQVLTDECSKLHSRVQVGSPILIQRASGIGVEKESKQNFGSSQIQRRIYQAFQGANKTTSLFCFWLGHLSEVYTFWDEFSSLNFEPIKH